MSSIGRAIALLISNINAKITSPRKRLYFGEQPKRMKASQKLTPSIAQMRGIKVIIVATAPVNCDHFVVDIEVIVVLTVKSIF